MAAGVLEQNRVNDGKPPNCNPLVTIEKTLSFSLTGSGYLAFSYNNPDTILDDGKPFTKALNIIIGENVYIILRLGPGQWSWSHHLEAITTKKDYQSIYGDLKYERNGQFIERPADVLNWDCMAVQFCARNNQPYHHPDGEHGFSMNIDLIQPNRKILPITLDPDILNPPPDDENYWNAKFLSAA